MCCQVYHIPSSKPYCPNHKQLLFLLRHRQCERNNSSTEFVLISLCVYTSKQSIAEKVLGQLLGEIMHWVTLRVFTCVSDICEYFKLHELCSRCTQHSSPGFPQESPLFGSSKHFELTPYSQFSIYMPPQYGLLQK